MLAVHIKLSFIRSQACKLQWDEKGGSCEDKAELQKQFRYKHEVKHRPALIKEKLYTTVLMRCTHYHIGSCLHMMLTRTHISCVSVQGPPPSKDPMDPGKEGRVSRLHLKEPSKWDSLVTPSWRIQMQPSKEAGPDLRHGPFVKNTFFYLRFAYISCMGGFWKFGRVYMATPYFARL